jgi:hypothetical protein
MNEPTLVALSVPELTAAAGIDPWKLQDQLLSGKPNQISLLAQEFNASGSHTREAHDAFTQAYNHFQNAHASDNGCNAINDSRVVSDTKAELKPTADKLDKIGLNLEEIAGALADAQNNTHGPIEALNRSLQQFDSEIVALPKHSHLVYEETRQGIEQDAAKVVHTVGEQLNGIVNDYENVLNARMKDIESTGYIPSVVLDDGAPTAQLPPPDTNPEHAGRAAPQSLSATRTPRTTPRSWYRERVRVCEQATHPTRAGWPYRVTRRRICTSSRTERVKRPRSWHGWAMTTHPTGSPLSRSPPSSPTTGPPPNAPVAFSWLRTPTDWRPPTRARRRMSPGWDTPPGPSSSPTRRSRAWHVNTSTTLCWLAPSAPTWHTRRPISTCPPDTSMSANHPSMGSRGPPTSI